MICSSCNKEINGIVKYCPYCGSEQYYSEAKSIYLQGIEIFDRGGQAREYFESTPPADRHTCSMCGKMCAVRTTNMILAGEEVEFCTEK